MYRGRMILWGHFAHTFFIFDNLKLPFSYFSVSGFACKPTPDRLCRTYLFTSSTSDAFCTVWIFRRIDLHLADISAFSAVKLLRNYGELSLIWFDVPITLEEKHSRAIFDLVKKYQPDCLINSRLGNGAYDYVSLGDNEVPESIPDNAELKESMMNAFDGFKPSPYGLYETAATVNNSWGYCAWDQNWKSANIGAKGLQG